jgi:hypothetical protein
LFGNDVFVHDSATMGGKVFVLIHDG